MTDTNHTPGPWHVVGPRCRVVTRYHDGGYREEVADCGKSPVDVRAANAALIASAPELLAHARCLQCLVEGPVVLDPRVTFSAPFAIAHDGAVMCVECALAQRPDDDVEGVEPGSAARVNRAQARGQR